MTKKFNKLLLLLLILNRALGRVCSSYYPVRRVQISATEQHARNYYLHLHAIQTQPARKAKASMRGTAKQKQVRGL